MPSRSPSVNVFYEEADDSHPYMVGVLKGTLLVNGKPAAVHLDHRQRVCDVVDSGDPKDLAYLAFSAGYAAARRNFTEKKSDASRAAWERRRKRLAEIERRRAEARKNRDGGNSL